MSKSRYWSVTLGLLTMAVVCVIFILAYLLVTLPVPAEQPSPTPRRPVLNLPTAPLPTTQFGPPLPLDVKFIAEEPIKGFSNCSAYGFRGVVKADEGADLAGLQIVVWEDQAGGLLAMGSTHTDGAYSIEIKEKPSQRSLWVQLYRNDVPVSEPLLMKTHLDCQNGFQIYQINWREKEQ